MKLDDCFLDGCRDKGKFRHIEQDDLWLNQSFCDRHHKMIKKRRISIGNIWINDKIQLKKLFRDDTSLLYVDGKNVHRYARKLVKTDVFRI